MEKLTRKKRPLYALKFTSNGILAPNPKFGALMHAPINLSLCKVVVTARKPAVFLLALLIVCNPILPAAFAQEPRAARDTGPGDKSAPADREIQAKPVSKADSGQASGVITSQLEESRVASGQKNTSPSRGQDASTNDRKK